MSSNQVVFLGTSDEVNECECCGRKALKATVALSIDGSDPIHFGCVCAARALGKSAKEIRASSMAAQRAKEAAEREARDKAQREEQARWEGFLAAMTGLRDWDGRVNVAGAIQKLGGMAAARAKYAEWIDSIANHRASLPEHLRA